MFEAIITGVVSGIIAGLITGLIISIVQFYLIRKLKKRIRGKWIDKAFDIGIDFLNHLKDIMPEVEELIKKEIERLEGNEKK